MASTLLAAPTLDQSEREPMKVGVALSWVDGRAERGCRDRPQLSSASALANESKFIKATLHTVPLGGKRPSRL
jgi:hypothetical protein